MHARQVARTRGDASFRRAWIGSVTAGEFVGFCVPALVGALGWDAAPALVLPALVAAGALEGAVLGWSQARVLRRRLPGLSARRWVAGTAAAAALAWGIGLTPSAAHAVWAAWPTPVLALSASAAGAALLCSIGFAQWLELRRQVPRSGSWVLASAAAWCAGLLAFTGVSSPLWHEGQSVLLIAVIGAVGGLAMAVAMAVVTGFAMAHLLGDLRDGRWRR